MSIHEKIVAAHRLFEQCGPRLQEQPAVSRDLAALRTRIEASGKAMVDCGLAEACTRCDRQEGGSCCGAGIEDRFGPVLLLMNLLLGADLPDERAFENSCFFLGSAGCMLKARELLCINYLCLRLQKDIPHEALLDLQRITGEEMDAIFRLHENLIQLIRSHV